jgi:WD40 repeat protein
MKQLYKLFSLFFIFINATISHGQDTITRPVMTLEGHKEDVEAIIYSPNGKFIASAGWDRTIRVWDAETGKEVTNFRAHDASVRCIAYNRDGKYIISGSRDNSVKIWDSAFTVKYSLYGHQNIINTVLLDPKMRYAYSGSADGAVKLWDLKKKGESRNLKKFEQPVNSIALSLSGADVFVATQGPDVFKLSVTGDVKATYSAHTDEVNSIAYSNNNKYLISGSSDKTAIIWNIQTGKVVHTLQGHSWKVLAVAFSWDSKYAITGSTDGTVKIWEVETGKLLRTYIGDVTSVAALAISPDITKLATTGMIPGDSKFLIYIWDTDLELESAKLARLKQFRADSIQHLKDSVQYARDSIKMVQDSLKKMQKEKREQEKKNPTPPKNDNKAKPGNNSGAILRDEEWV